MSIVTAVFTHSLIEAAVRIVGLSLLAFVVTGLASFVFRVRVRSTFPEGATLILGLGVVAIYLNTRLVFVQFLGDAGDPLTTGEAIINVSVFVAAGVASYGGRYAGDKAGTSGRIPWGRFQPDFSPIVRAAGRFITVTLPEDIKDIEGYDSVDEEAKEALAGRRMDFPRGLTLAELQSQVIARLKEEHQIGYVDIDMSADGTVGFLAVGQRAAGLGPTLPPKSAAVAVRADPPFSATPGDTVQLWRVDAADTNEDSDVTGEGTTERAGDIGGDDVNTGTDTGRSHREKRIGTGELRASAGKIVTIATEETVADRIDPTVDHRLMTLSADTHPDREFAAMLRRGDETMSIVDISAESPLVGSSIGALDVTIIAVRSAGGDVETIPKRDRLVAAGDSLFAIERPETLRKLESSKGTQTAELDSFGRKAATGALLFSQADRERQAEREDWTEYDDDISE